MICSGVLSAMSWKARRTPEYWAVIRSISDGWMTPTPYTASPTVWIAVPPQRAMSRPPSPSAERASFVSPRTSGPPALRSNRPSIRPRGQTVGNGPLSSKINAMASRGKKRGLDRD